MRPISYHDNIVYVESQPDLLTDHLNRCRYIGQDLTNTSYIERSGHPLHPQGSPSTSLLSHGFSIPLQQYHPSSNPDVDASFRNKRENGDTLPPLSQPHRLFHFEYPLPPLSSNSPEDCQRPIPIIYSDSLASKPLPHQPSTRNTAYITKTCSRVIKARPDQQSLAPTAESSDEYPSQTTPTSNNDHSTDSSVTYTLIYPDVKSDCQSESNDSATANNSNTSTPRSQPGCGGSRSWAHIEPRPPQVFPSATFIASTSPDEKKAESKRKNGSPDQSLAKKQKTVRTTKPTKAPKLKAEKKPVSLLVVSPAPENLLT